MMRTKYHDSLFFHFGGGGKLLSSPHQLSFHLHQTHMGHMYRPAATENVITADLKRS